MWGETISALLKFGLLAEVSHPQRDLPLLIHLECSPILFLYTSDNYCICVFILFITYLFNYLHEVFTNTLPTLLVIATT